MGETPKTEQKTAAPATPPPATPPVAYALKAPEGVAFDGETLQAYEQSVRELNLPPKEAQALLDKVGPAMHQQTLARVEALKQEWADATRADKELGGDKLAESLGVAKKALERFGTPELHKLLNETGLGNNLEVIRLLHRAGKAISEDSFVAGKTASGKGLADLSNPEVAAARLYPNHK